MAPVRLNVTQGMWFSELEHKPFTESDAGKLQLAVRSMLTGDENACVHFAYSAETSRVDVLLVLTVSEVAQGMIGKVGSAISAHLQSLD